MAVLARQQTAHSTLGRDLKAILSRKQFETTTKEALIDARVGQGLFRSLVLSSWNGRCAVTGCRTLEAIRASHIKPWRDSHDSERLDPMNGLPLVATLDALLDAGLISFEDSGRMLISSRLPRDDQELLGIDGRHLAKRPPAEMMKYLKHHRTAVFCD